MLRPRAFLPVLGLLVGVLLLLLLWMGPDEVTSPLSGSAAPDGNGSADTGTTRTSPLLTGTAAARRTSPRTPDELPPESTSGAEETERTSLVGTVFDEDGRPVRGVAILCRQAGGTGWIVYDRGEKIAPKDISDTDGRYRADLEPGHYIVRARLGERGSQRHEVLLPRAEPLDLDLIEASATLRVRFRTRGPDVDPRDLGIRVSSNRGHVEAADPGGDVLVSGLRLGDVLSVSVKLETPDRSLAFLPAAGARREYLIGGRRMRAEMTLEQLDTVHTFQLARLARLRVRLLVPSGSPPAAGYKVLCRQDSSWSPAVTLEASQATPTYSAWVLPERPISLFVPPVQVGGRTVATPRPVLLDPLRSGEEVSVDLRLLPLRGGVRGNVVDAEGGAAPGCGLRVIHSLPSDLHGLVPASPFRHVLEGKTGPNGSFQLLGLLDCDTTLRISPSKSVQGVSPLPIPISGWNDSVLSLGTIRLPLGGAIDGTLRFENGRPTSGGKQIGLRIVPVGAGGRPVTGRMFSLPVANKEGATFRLEKLAPATYRVLGSGPFLKRWAAPLAEIRVEPGERAAIDVRLP